MINSKGSNNIIFYAYMNNIYSCRKIAKALDENLHYMWLSGDQYPSFSTINGLRSNHCKDSVNKLFSRVVMPLVEMGHVSLDTVYVDGTKVESVTNKYTFVWRKNVERYKGNLEKKIHCILSQIEEGITGDITNFGLYPNPGDTTTLFSFLCLYRSRLGKLTTEPCADAGYGSEENYKLLVDNDIKAFVKYNQFH